MTLVDADTGEIAVMSEVDARELIDSLKRAVEIAESQIIRAWRGRAWLALGYESWDEMVAHEFTSQYVKIAPDERRAAAVEMAKAGMSTRAIGTAIGVSHQTVANDIAGVNNLTPADESGDADPDPVAEVVDTPAVTVGLDGKTYTRPTPKTLSAEEQRSVDLAEAAARAARALERISSCWPYLDNLAASGERDAVLAHLTELDRRRIEHIEAHLTSRPLFPNGSDPEAS